MIHGTANRTSRRRRRLYYLANVSDALVTVLTGIAANWFGFQYNGSQYYATWFGPTS